MKKYNIFFNIVGTITIFSVIIWCIAFILFSTRKTLHWAVVIGIATFIFAMFCLVLFVIRLIIKAVLRKENKICGYTRK